MATCSPEPFQSLAGSTHSTTTSHPSHGSLKFWQRTQRPLAFEQEVSGDNQFVKAQDRGKVAPGSLGSCRSDVRATDNVAQGEGCRVANGTGPANGPGGGLAGNMNHGARLQIEGKPETPEYGRGEVADDGVRNRELVGARPFDNVSRYRGMQPYAARRFCQVFAPQPPRADVPGGSLSQIECA